MGESGVVKVDGFVADGLLLMVCSATPSSCSVTTLCVPPHGCMCWCLCMPTRPLGGGETMWVLYYISQKAIRPTTSTTAMMLCETFAERRRETGI